jgi:uncharacterized membrane protein YfcA
MWILFFIAGIMGGLLGGMGMGGGTLLIPMLTLALDVPQKTAQTLNLIAFLPMSLFALAIHLKNKLVDRRFIALTAVPAFAAAVFASLFAVQAPPDSLRKAFGWFLITVGAVFLITSVMRKNKTA